MWERITRLFGYVQEDKLENYEAYIGSTHISGKLVGHPFPITTIEVSQGDTFQTDFSGNKAGLVMLFEPMSCQPCLELLLKTLQHIHTDLKDPVEVPIYGIALNFTPKELSTYKRAFKLEYQLGGLLQKDALPLRLVEHTPIVFLVDSNNTILQCHSPVIGKEHFSAHFFYKLVFNHLPFLEVNTEGFEDSPLRKIQGSLLLEFIEGNYDREILFW